LSREGNHDQEGESPHDARGGRLAALGGFGIGGLDPPMEKKDCPDIGKDPEPYFRRAAEALKLDEHKGEYIANLCRWAHCVAERKRFEDADGLYGKLLTFTDDSPEWHSNWHWILSNCVEYFQSRGKGDLVAHLTKENEYDAYGDLVRQRLEHAERT
jgi:hypothetical protein